MKSLMQKEKGKSFDWNKFLKNAIRRKTPIEDDVYDEVCNLSANWVTCACGNQCSILPRDEDNEPIDGLLNLWGIEFNEYIEDQDWVNAKHCLSKIENRSATLIQKTLSEYIEALEDAGYVVMHKKECP